MGVLYNQKGNTTHYNFYFFPCLIVFTRAFSKELVVWHITWYDRAHFCVLVGGGGGDYTSFRPPYLWRLGRNSCGSGANHYSSLIAISRVTMLSLNWSSLCTPCLTILPHCGPLTGRLCTYLKPKSFFPALPQKAMKKCLSILTQKCWEFQSVRNFNQMSRCWINAHVEAR